MVDVPGVFSRSDFVSILLPGYVNVVSAVVIFRPGLLTVKDLSFDLFSTVLLLVAGPSVGITLRQLYRTGWLVYDKIKERTKEGENGPSEANARSHLKSVPPGPPKVAQGSENWSTKYARVRLTADARGLAELDATEADMDFMASTALGLFLQALATLFIPLPQFVTLGLLIVSLVLFTGGYFEWSDTFTPTYHEIESRHPV